MRIGVETFFMVKSSKWRSEATPLGEAGQVLTRTPFMVFVRVQFLTVTPMTGSSFWYLPKLPTLMPWPGPQVIPSTVTCWAPSPRDTQSSPVLISAPEMVIPFDLPMWMPSVLRLLSGAVIVMPWKVTLLQLMRFMWNSLLFKEVMPWICEFLTELNPKFCSNYPHGKDATVI